MSFVDRDCAMARRRNKLMQSMVDSIKYKLTEHGLAQDAADLVANSVADQLADDWGGQIINIPTNYRLRLSQREAQIYEDYKSGASLAEISHSIGMHERSVRKIIDKIRERILAAARANNRDLFDE